MTDSYFLDLSRKCESLELFNSNFCCISPVGLHNVYKVNFSYISIVIFDMKLFLFTFHVIISKVNVIISQIMIDDSTSFHYLLISELKMEALKTFLNFLGIAYRNGQVFSNRNIEVFLVLLIFSIFHFRRTRIIMPIMNLYSS